MKSIITLVTLFLFLLTTSPVKGQIEIEKLDSIWYYNVVEEYYAGKTFFAYNSSAQDTLIDAYLYRLNSESLEPNGRRLISYDENQRVVESFIFENNEYQEIWLENYQLNEDGETEELLQSRWSAPDAAYEPATKQVTTVRTSTSIETEIHEWQDNSFQLKFLTIEQTTPVQYISTSFRNEGGLFVPLNRRIKHYDIETGLEILFALEYYDEPTESWTVIASDTTVIDAQNNTAEKTDSVLASSTDDELSLRSTETISYDENWQVIEKIIYDYEDDGTVSSTMKYEYTYTEKGNILSNSFYQLIDGEWIFEEIDNYFYTTFEITPITELSPLSFPIDLVYQNPTTSSGHLTIEGALPLEAPIHLTITDINGRTLDQQKVQAGQQIALIDFQLSDGLYFITLRIDNQQKTWKVIVH